MEVSEKITKFLIIFLLTKCIPVVFSITFADESQNKITKCVANLYKKNKETYTFLISYINENVLDNNGLYNNYNGFTYFKEDKFEYAILSEKHQMFIILIENVQQFVELTDILSNSQVWNSRGKFIIGYYGDEDFGEIFNISWKYYIFNINVIASNNLTTNVYSFFPYQNGLCGNYVYYKQLYSCKDEMLFTTFPPKIPFNLNGCEVKVMAYIIPPYVINLNNSPEDPGKSGLEVTIIHNVAKRMNIKLNFVNNPYTHWGYHYKNGSCTMMYKALKDRVTDIIFGFTYGNSSYSDDFDASFCHLGDSSIWFFSSAPEMAQWKNLTNIFERDLWLAIFGMLLINGISWWIIGHSREKSDEFNDLTICILSSMYLLLQGSVKSPTTWKVRIIFILWLLTCLLIFTAHQCQLISILTSPLYEHQMTTLEELIESRIDFGFYPTIEDAYRDSNSINKQILKRYQPCPLTAECLNRTAFQRDYAVVKNRRQVLYLMPRFYTFPNGRSMLYDTGIASFTTKERYYTYKGFPLLERFDYFLMLLSSNGLINKWDADTGFFVYKVESTSESEPLTLGHLQGAFYIYLFGMCFALLTLILEYVKNIFSIKNKYQNKNNLNRY